MKVTNKFRILSLGLITLGATALWSPAHAMAVLCSASAPGPHPNGLSVSDVTFDNSDADDCYGVVEQDGMLGTQIGDSLNTGFTGDPWTFLVKDDVGDGVTSNMGSFGNVDFTLNATPDGTESSLGNWTLSWSGSGLPITLDIAAVLKASDRWANYLFEALTFNLSPNSGTGTWQISFLNNGGRIPNLSNFQLWVREADDTTIIEAPEPGILGLLGIGLLGMGLARRRRYRH